MTQQQRAQVWQRKGQLTAHLLHTTNADAQKRIKDQIEATNQSLVSDVFILPSEPVEPLLA